MSDPIFTRAKRYVQHVLRMDRWINARSGFGGNADPNMQTDFSWVKLLGRNELTALYIGDWVTRRAVEAPVHDALREWFTINHATDTGAADKLNAQLDLLDVRGAFKEAGFWSRLYGGCAIVIGVFDGQEMTQPLNLKAVQDVNYLYVADRWHCWPITYDLDPQSRTFGKPETYTVVISEVGGTKNVNVHASRLIRFDGVALPKPIQLRNFGWGGDIITSMYDALQSYGTTAQSMASIVQDYITMVLKISNLQELLANGDETAINIRIGQVAGERSTHNLVAIGADEEAVKLGTPISGLPELMDKFITIVSAATGIPRSRLFDSEGGTIVGDGGASSEMRRYYDDVRAMQRNVYVHKLRRLIQIVGATPEINIDIKDVTIEPNSLWQMTDKEMADILNSVAQADAINMQWGVYRPDEVRRTRFSGPGINFRDMVLDEELDDGDEALT